MAFIGKINGRTYRNGTNVTYQSMIDGELLYEYQVQQMYKKTASFRCAGCRSAMRDGRAPEFKPGYLSGKIDFEAKTVIFKKDPDMEPHCCERRHPDFVKSKQLKINVKKNVKETGISSSFLPLPWMEEIVDHLIANPPELNPLLKPAYCYFNTLLVLINRRQKCARNFFESLYFLQLLVFQLLDLFAFKHSLFFH